MTEGTQDIPSQNSALKALVIAVLLAAAFLGAYKLANARSGQTGASVQATAEGGYYGQFTAHTHPAGTPAHGDGAKIALANTETTGCPMGSGAKYPTKDGITGEREAGTAQVVQGTQRIAVAIDGKYSPNVIRLKAGVPAEITFDRSQGCTMKVMSDVLGFSAFVLNGPAIVKLGNLKKGTYPFSCYMKMVFGVIEVY